MLTRTRMVVGIGLLALCLLLAIPLAAALNGFDLSWHVLPGGGGQSTGGGLAVSGSVGQPIVGSSAGGGFGVTGGFWTFGGAAPPGPTETLPPGPTATLPPGPTETLPPGPTATLPPGPTPTLPPEPTETLPACPNMLEGGDFEGEPGPPWSWFGVARRSTDLAHGGSHSVQVVGENNDFGEVQAHLELPEGVSSITLSFWWYLDSADPDPEADWMTVVLGGPAGETPLEHLTNLSPRGSWQLSTHDVTDRAGQELAIIWVAENNGDFPSRFFVDDVELRVCGAGPPPGEERVFLPIIKRAGD